MITPIEQQTIRELIGSRAAGNSLPRAFYRDGLTYRGDIERIWRRGCSFAAHNCQISDFVKSMLDTKTVRAKSRSPDRLRKRRGIGAAPAKGPTLLRKLLRSPPLISLR